MGRPLTRVNGIVKAQQVKLDNRLDPWRSTDARCSTRRSITAPAVHSHIRPERRRGFSLLELLIVIVATVVLAGLLFPALADLRENANRVICASNQRQIGMAMFMYDRDFESLPYTSRLNNERWIPQDLNIAHVGGDLPRWDGVGLLFVTGYCRSPNCYYCPSHRGEHMIQDDLDEWYHPGKKDLYTNFHYGGDVDWITGLPRDLSRALNHGDRMVLLTDGLSSRQDLNHTEGLNVLFADGSVQWREGLDDIAPYIPLSSNTSMSMDELVDYQKIWSIIENGDGEFFTSE